MRSARGAPPDLATRVADFLRKRGAPASSRMLAERFLKLNAGSEELATAVVRPSLEEAGLRYVEAEGWQPPGAVSGTGPPAVLVAAAVDPRSGEPVVVELATGDARPADRLPGAEIVVADRRARFAIAAWLAQRRLAAAASIVPLRSFVRGAVRLPRDADLETICAALQVRWLEGDDPADQARALAACAREAGARRAASRADEGGLSADAESAALPGRLTAEQLAALPDAPGVYRFLDRDGRLLYVGKAKNLRTRVGSYFRPGRRAGHGARFLDRVDRLEIEEKASELEALLREARLIRSGRPAGNVQVQVHERGAAYDAVRTWALLLPDRDGRTITAVLVREGRYLGRLAIGARGGGLASARCLLGRAVCPGPSRTVRAPDRDTRILTSWLAKNAGAVSRLDLTGVSKASDAEQALREAARALRADPGLHHFRPRPPEE